jgi:hypothetical protein
MQMKLDGSFGEPYQGIMPKHMKLDGISSPASEEKSSTSEHAFETHARLVWSCPQAGPAKPKLSSTNIIVARLHTLV